MFNKLFKNASQAVLYISGFLIPFTPFTSLLSLLQPASAVMWEITVMPTRVSVSVLQTLLVRGVTAVLQTTGVMISSMAAR